jgi:hypothetical protein
VNDEERARRREYLAAYREKNREKVNAYQRAYMQKWRSENPERIDAIATRSYDNNGMRQRAARRAAFDLLKSAPCQDCNVVYPPYVMQFDHRDPDEKLFPVDIGVMMRSEEKRATELAKCDLVCANCHAERTHQQRLAGRRFGGAPRTRKREQVL